MHFKEKLCIYLLLHAKKMAQKWETMYTLFDFETPLTT